MNRRSFNLSLSSLAALAAAPFAMFNRKAQAAEQPQQAPGEHWSHCLCEQCWSQYLLSDIVLIEKTSRALKLNRISIAARKTKKLVKSFHPAFAAVLFLAVTEEETIGGDCVMRPAVVASWFRAWFSSDERKLILNSVLSRKAESLWPDGQIALLETYLEVRTAFSAWLQEKTKEIVADRKALINQPGNPRLTFGDMVIPHGAISREVTRREIAAWFSRPVAETL